MADATDDVNLVASLRGDLPQHWSPTEIHPDDADVELTMMRHEAFNRANMMLEKAQTFRRWSLFTMATLPAAIVVAVPNYHYMSSKELRVDRIRKPAKALQARRLFYGSLFYFMGGIFIWPSPWGFRARAERLERLSKFYDGLAWDTGVVRNELVRGTLDAEALLRRDEERRQAAREEEQEKKTAALRGDTEEALAALKTGEEADLERAFQSQFMKKADPAEQTAAGDAAAENRDAAVRAVTGAPEKDSYQVRLLEQAASTSGREVTFDMYGVPLNPDDADRLRQRQAAAAELSPLARLYYNLQERRYALDGMA